MLEHKTETLRFIAEAHYWNIFSYILLGSAPESRIQLLYLIAITVKL